MRFIFFSKTMYSETPRIRHQLAELLLTYGHDVIFYQRPLFFFNSDENLINQKISEKLEIRQTKQLIHHQLRLFEALSFLNSWYEMNQIISSLNTVNHDDIIVNFNYDYSFLRKIFKNNKIITLINDDFVAQAKFNKGVHILKSLGETLRISDAVLTVSYPLLNQAKAFSQHIHLFLPWSKEKFIQPSHSERKAVLLWAHIDGRVDFELIEYILNKNIRFEFHFIGPVSEKNLAIIETLQKNYSNLVLFPATELSCLNLDLYFASIIPYKSGVADIEAVTASNKTFQLLSKGLPLVTYGMPSFFEHEAIFKANSYPEFSEFIFKAYSEFYSLQPSIAELIKQQQPEQRYAKILSIINED